MLCCFQYHRLQSRLSKSMLFFRLNEHLFPANGWSVACGSAKCTQHTIHTQHCIRCLFACWRLLWLQNSSTENIHIYTHRYSERERGRECWLEFVPECRSVALAIGRTVMMIHKHTHRVTEENEFYICVCCSTPSSLAFLSLPYILVYKYTAEIIKNYIELNFSDAKKISTFF